MIRTFTLCFLVFIVFESYAQSRLIKGYLYSEEDGSPLPGVNIVIKGTQTGTVSDIDGYYEITAPIGSVLVFTFVGLSSKEILVTPEIKSGKTVNLSQAVTREEEEVLRTFKLNRTDTLTEGQAALNAQSPTYKSKGILSPSMISEIRKQENGNYILKMFTDPILSRNMKFEYITRAGINMPNRLPKLQSEFAQGVARDGRAVWQGPETGIPFSWGPQMNILQFDDSPYPYDLNGRLNFTDGTGKPAIPYDNLSFLGRGYSFANHLTLTSHTITGGNLTFMINQEKNEHLIPGAHVSKLGGRLKLTNLSPGKNWVLNSVISYHYQGGPLWPHGSNLSRVMAGTLATPVSFDNSNGVSPWKALRSPESYTLPNGAPRSFAPDQFDNPYGLVNQLPDKDRNSQAIVSLDLNRFIRINNESNLTIFLKAFGQKEVSDSHYGSFNPALTTTRDVERTDAGSALSLTYYRYAKDFTMTLKGRYAPKYQTTALDRTDKFGADGASDSTSFINNSLSRLTQEIAAEADVTFKNWLKISLTNNSYVSSTSENRLFLPGAQIAFTITNLFTYYYGPSIKLFSTFSESVTEAPLLHSSWAYLSVNGPVSEFQNMYESGEIFFHSGLEPERKTSWEAGLITTTGNFSSTLTIYRNTTMNFIAVDPKAGRMINAGNMLDRGIDLATQYDGYLYNGRWSIACHYTAWEPLITELIEEKLPVAGFTTVQTVLHPDQPVGSIYGTAFARDGSGNILIGQDGFPIENETLQKIGNPNPDWRMGFTGNISWKQLSLSVQLEGQRGGDMWNGTRAYLDYLGRSKDTGEERRLSQYIFPGVGEDGIPNTIPVTFYDPAKPLQENRWVRYGPDGVGEAYIKDASWLRIRDIALSYSFTRLPVNYLESIEVMISASNILLYSAYRGVDPEASLYSYSEGIGLDLFNVPSPTRMNLQLTAKF